MTFFGGAEELAATENNCTRAVDREETVRNGIEYKTVNGDTPTPDEAMAKLVRMYARKVRSEARWSRATLPEFTNVSEVLFLTFSRRDSWGVGRGPTAESLEIGWTTSLDCSGRTLGGLAGVDSPGVLLASKSKDRGSFLLCGTDWDDAPPVAL